MCSFGSFQQLLWFQLTKICLKQPIEKGFQFQLTKRKEAKFTIIMFQIISYPLHPLVYHHLSWYSLQKKNVNSLVFSCSSESDSYSFHHSLKSKGHTKPHYVQLQCRTHSHSPNNTPMIMHVGISNAIAQCLSEALLLETQQLIATINYVICNTSYSRLTTGSQQTSLPPSTRNLAANSSKSAKISDSL